MIIKWKSLAAVVVASALVGCGITGIEKEDEEEAETKDDGKESGTVVGDGGATTERAKEAEDISELGLSKAFELTLPGALALDDSGSSLNLTSDLKSQEACEMGNTVKEITRSLNEVGNFFCHIEAEKDKIKFGVKTKITFEGNTFAHIWVDTSGDDKVRIGFCSNDEYGENNQIIDVTGLSDAGPVGVIINKGTNESDDEDYPGTQKYHRSVEFDMSLEGTAKVLAQDVHERTHEDESDKFNREVLLTLVEEGVSEAIVAARGSWQGGDFSERGRALFDGEYGSAVFENTGTHDGNEYSHSRKAFFDEPGNVVGEDASEEFAEDGSLHLNKDDLPEYLSDDFAPIDLDGWVAGGCEGTDAEAELNPDSAEHQACDGDNHKNEHVNCWDEAEFQSGEELE